MMNILHDLQWVLPLRSDAGTQLAMAFSWLGYATFLMFFMSIGYWVWNKERFFRLLVVVTCNALLNAYAKDLFQDPRPPLEIRLDDLVGASYGLPSGHAQMAVALWMWLAWEVRRTWVWWACSAIALGVMFSRLYLGVHDLEDVLGGALLGGASLFVFAWARRVPSPLQHSLAWQLAAILGVAIAALLSWPGGQSPDYVPMLTAWLATATACLHWDRRHPQFAAPSGPARIVAAALLGALLFWGEQKLLKTLGLQLQWEPTLWSACKGMVSGAFVALFVPWVLRMVRLAPQRRARPLF
jgi:membrane-associated phospholipid phosphatase